MWNEPGDYGITIQPGTRMTEMGLRIPFDEIGGLSFEERLTWARKDERGIRDAVARCRPSRHQDTGDCTPFHLIFFLYDIYGHDKKAIIQRIYEESGASDAATAAAPTRSISTPRPRAPKAVDAGSVAAPVLVKMKRLCALLKARLIGAQSPCWAGVHLVDAFLREPEPVVWLRLERDAGRQTLARLFLIRGPEDRFAARLGPFGISIVATNQASDEAPLAEALKGLLRVAILACRQDQSAS
jgi:hypothetical protein